MQTPGEYTQWYYLLYLLPGGVALLLLLLSSIGGGRHHRGTAGQGRHHAGSGGHHTHAGARGGAKHSAAKGGRGGEPMAPSAAQQMLAAFGVGRMPVPFVWGSFLLGWGLFGYWGTRLWEAALHRPSLFALPALITAVAGSLATARLTAALGARLLPQEASSALSTIDLCGRIGTVTFPADESRGRIHVYDEWGTLHDVPARVAPGQPPIARGCRALVTDYDAARDRVIVEEML